MKEQVGRESNNVTSTSLSPSKKNMRRRSEESDQIEPVQGFSASLVFGNPISSKRIPAQQDDLTTDSGQVTGLALAEEAIIGEEGNVVEEECEKETGQGNEQCWLFSDRSTDPLKRG